jgi:hypothetical protein
MRLLEAQLAFRFVFLIRLLPMAGGQYPRRVELVCSSTQGVWNLCFQCVRVPVRARVRLCVCVRVCVRVLAWLAGWLAGCLAGWLAC